MLSNSTMKTKLNMIMKCILLLLGCINGSEAILVKKLNTEIQNVVINENSIYVGATNRLYRLDHKLNIIRSNITGPKNDNPLCLPAQQDQVVCLDANTKPRPTNNYNKILMLVDKPVKSLLVCGTLYQGMCYFYSLDSLTDLLAGNETFLSVVRPISSNLKDASTVALVKTLKSGASVLIVAKTKTVFDKTFFEAYYDIMAAKRLTKLNTNFLKYYKDKRKSEFHVRYDKNLQKANKATFLVDYKMTFADGKFVYYLTVQRESPTSQNYLSKVVRITATEEVFGGYIEQPLTCSKSNIKYNVLVAATKVKLTKDNMDAVNGGEDNDTVIFGLFTKSSNNDKANYQGYAICYYLLSSVNDALNENVRKCNVDKVDLPVATWVVGSRRCKGSSTSTIHLAPNNGILGTYLFSQVSPALGSVFSYGHTRGLALFVSSSTNLHEFSVGPNSLYEYGNKLLDSTSQSLFTQPVIDPQKEHLYLKAFDKLVKVPIKDCSIRKNCMDCLSGPACGWCTLENKCSLKSECSASDLLGRFIGKDAAKCPKVISVQPNVTSITVPTKITLEMGNIPTDVEYFCSINGILRPVVINGRSFECAEIDFKIVPNFKPTQGAGDVKVSLVTQAQRIPIVETTVSVYDCSSFSMCQSCVSGIYDCGWCLKCTHKSDSCNNPQSWIKHQGVGSSSDTCASVTSSSVSLIASGTNTEITLQGNNLPSAQNLNYHCILKYGNTTKKISATRVTDTQLICEKTKISYDAEIESLDVKIDVSYGNTYIDASSVKVLIYKCHVNREDCSICLEAHKEWKCGWCSSTTQCAPKELCEQNDSWTDKNCPGPFIREFEPFAGAIGGGTNLTIIGSDLGTSPENVSVTVAGRKCELINALYKKSQRIVCITGAVASSKEGRIVVTVNASAERILNGTSKSDFFYREPYIMSIFPTEGPCSGGTKLSIRGNFLNVGNSVEVEVSRRPCEVIERSSNSIKCITKAMACSKRKRRTVTGGIVVIFDGYAVKGSTIDTSFSYKIDPVVTDVFTNKEMVRIRTFASGGQVFKVEGQRLFLIQEPKMTFSVPHLNILEKSNCTLYTNISQMICLAPNVSMAMMNKEVIWAWLGFEMDHVANVRRFKNITIVKDPVFEMFGNDDGVLEVKTEDLILSGSRLNVLSKGDVQVYVGGRPCEVTDLDERLVCTLPAEKDVQSSEGMAAVRVVVGQGGLEYKPGFIKFYKATKESIDWMLYIGPIIAGVVVLMIIIIILVILYRRKHKKDKEYQELVQIQMDQMESKYARECKEAFAEYQTEITDLTQDVDQNITPFHDFKAFAMRVLYPGLITHTILEHDKDERDEWKDSMISMIDLLKNEDFLLTFIRTLEGQSSFQMNDRCMVASLLMVSLQDDVKYITSILRSLLMDLIQKTGTGKRPKLLLRRTESVAEKLLTNWLAYTLHDFLESHVGERLFKLFTAINILLEKEPIDAITADARNSLSEDKLLRQKIDFKPLVVNVAYVTDVNGGLYERISVLSCDTITQAKVKILKYIYKNKPYTEWPPLEELYLGFLSANGAVLVLQDEDSTNIVEGDWKKVNTLDHYKVPDNSSLRLADREALFLNNESGILGVDPRVTSPPIIVKTSSRRRLSSRSSRSMQELDKSDPVIIQDNSLPPIAFHPNHSSTPMLNHQDNPHEPKLWHMVKQTDYPQEQKEDIRHSKMMAEVYLTRLLKTKETLQTFVNTLFDSIFGVHDGQRRIPPSVKFLFDFLDEQAEELEITDDEVHHTWKNNSLPLRFWINMIKNPDFVFDIKKSNTVDSCLSVIAQLFMDSCSPDDHRLGKDSPSNKLLYAKEIPDYKKKVKRFYADVRTADFNKESFDELLDEISEKYGSTFNSCNAASELMTYAVDYKVKVMENLDDNGFSEHAEKLQQIMESIPDDP